MLFWPLYAPWAWAFYSWQVLRLVQQVSPFAVYELPAMRRLSPQTGGNVIWLAEWRMRHGR